MAFDVRIKNAGPPTYITPKEIRLGKKPGAWHGRYGAGTVLHPRFPGAKSYNIDVDLDLKLSWKDRVFLENNTLAAIFLDQRFFRTGVLLRGVQGRRVKRLPTALKGLGRVDDRLDAGLFAASNFYKTYLRFEALGDISHSTGGGTVELELGYTHELARHDRLVPHVRLQWGSAKHLQSFYGVNTAQSLATGLPTFAARRSLAQMAAGLTYEHNLGERWLVIYDAEATRLRGSAARSPISKSGFGSKGQFSARLRLSRTF